MHKSKNLRMKRLTLKGIWALRRPIDLISKKRMMNTGHMDTDLMGSASLQHAFNIGILAETFQHPVMGNGFFSIFFINGHLFPVCRMTADGCVDSSLILFQHAMDDCPVPSVDAVFL